MALRCFSAHAASDIVIDAHPHVLLQLSPDLAVERSAPDQCPDAAKESHCFSVRSRLTRVASHARSITRGQSRVSENCLNASGNLVPILLPVGELLFSGLRQRVV